MIRESIVITTDLKKKPHVVPMGITFNKKKLFIKWQYKSKNSFKFRKIIRFKYTKN